ncbi:flagellar protein FlaG [Ornithinibacillus contaminans]|uniref:flagellar protein FlaG n=1 Tax=Ornithinibacillus contaminans TaxID=694055 RepID=UPI00064E05BF|nr:flagellar protein FlaG [Ornithinibacillus contaminans]
MRLDSLSNNTQPLQNSDSKRVAAEVRTVVQDRQPKEFGTLDPKQQKSEVETAVQKLNDFVEPLQTNLKFELHDELNEYYVTIVDPKTNEVIKEIPSKKILDMYAAMADYMGFLIDKKI